jgi:hypothetical protein
MASAARSNLAADQGGPRRACGRTIRSCCLSIGAPTSSYAWRHKGRVEHEVIEGAFRVLDDFEAVNTSTEGMKALSLNPEEERAFATAALALRYGEQTEGQAPAPITVDQLTEARRVEDTGRSLWLAMNRVQSNIMQGGQPGRTARGRRMHTRAVGSIDRTVTLNRALWVLAEEMRKLKTYA